MIVASYGTLTPVSAGLIAGGVAHFAAAASEYSKTGDWNAASNNAGISFSYTVDPGWGDSDPNKVHISGVAQNEPVVKTKTEVGGKEKDNGMINSMQNFYNSNHEIFRTHFNTAEIVGGTAEIYGSLAAPFTEGTSLEYAVYGAKMSAYGTFGNSTMDILDGHYSDAAYRWTQFAISAGMGKAIESGVPYNTLKNMLNAFKTYSETYILPVLNDSWYKFNAPKKSKWKK